MLEQKIWDWNQFRFVHEIHLHIYSFFFFFICFSLLIQKALCTRRAFEKMKQYRMFNC